MKKILVPTDFSPASMAAYRFAIEFATRVDGELVVAHVIDIPIIQETTFGLQPYLYAQETFRDAFENSQRLYRRLKDLYPTDVPVTFRPIHDDLVSGLSEFIQTNHIDLVIMSARGASEIEEFISGSPTKKVARHSPVPVITVPNEISLSSVRDIVFPNNLDSDQEHLIEMVSEFQRKLNARLHLLFVNTPSNTHTAEASAKMLKDFAAYYRLENYTINFRYSDSEKAGIIAFAREIHADMIAMGTHGRTGLAHFFKGSIAESVLDQIDCPVWVSKLL